MYLCMYIRRVDGSTHFAMAPVMAALRLALDEVSLPVLMENPFTFGLYFLIISARKYNNYIKTITIMSGLPTLKVHIRLRIYTTYVYSKN